MLDGGGVPEAAIPLAVAKPNIVPISQKESNPQGDNNHTKIEIGVLNVTSGKNEEPKQGDPAKDAQADKLKVAEALQPGEIVQSKEDFMAERGFIGTYAINLIKDAKIKATTTNGEEALGLKKEVLEQRRKVLMNKLSLGGAIDVQDKELLGMLEYQFPPTDIIKREGDDPILEPRVSLTTLLDYYYQSSTPDLDKKGSMPKLSLEAQKNIRTAAEHLGIITVNPEKGGLPEAVERMIYGLFEKSKPPVPQDKIKDIILSVTSSLDGRLIITEEDFNPDPEKGIFARIGKNIIVAHKESNWANENEGSPHPQIGPQAEAILSRLEGLAPIFKHEEVVTGFMTEAFRDIKNKYGKLVKGELKGKDLLGWFRSFGPAVKGENQAMAMVDTFFSKDSVANAEFKRKMGKAGKAGSLILMLMLLLEGYLASKTISGQPQHG